MTNSEISNLEWRVTETAVDYRNAQAALRPIPMNTPLEALRDKMNAEVAARSAWEKATDALIEAREERGKIMEAQKDNDTVEPIRGQGLRGLVDLQRQMNDVDDAMLHHMRLSIVEDPIDRLRTLTRTQIKLADSERDT